MNTRKTKEEKRPGNYQHQGKDKERAWTGACLARVSAADPHAAARGHAQGTRGPRSIRGTGPFQDAGQDGAQLRCRDPCVFDRFKLSVRVSEGISKPGPRRRLGSTWSLQNEDNEL